ncbi:hypothetical protein BJ912DRAFT_929789 [Pholiota molesta]|nr:hypothetical protein BJ912DRAFT_929789 [Pholiota molesta]
MAAGTTTMAPSPQHRAQPLVNATRRRGLPRHPLPSALQLHASAEGNATIREQAPATHAALAEGCEECIPLAPPPSPSTAESAPSTAPDSEQRPAVALDGKHSDTSGPRRGQRARARRSKMMPPHLPTLILDSAGISVVVPAPTTTTTADTTMRRSRTATTAAGNGSENGTGGEHDNGHVSTRHCRCTLESTSMPRARTTPPTATSALPTTEDTNPTTRRRQVETTQPMSTAAGHGTRVPAVW